MSRLDSSRWATALVDVLTHGDDDFVARTAVEPGAMTMVDAARSDEIYAENGTRDGDVGRVGCEHRRRCRVVGGHAAYIGRWPTTPSARCSRTTCAAWACSFDAPIATTGSPTGRCLVIVHPRRAAHDVHVPRCGGGARRVVRRRALVASAAVTYLEGYIWDPPAAKEAVRRAAAIAHRADRRVALTLSDPFCVERHRAEFLELIAGDIDILSRTSTRSRRCTKSTRSTRRLPMCAGTCEIAALTRGAHRLVIVAGDDVHVDRTPIRRGRRHDRRGRPLRRRVPVGLTHGYRSQCGQLASLAAGRGDLASPAARPAVSLADVAQPLLGG